MLSVVTMLPVEQTEKPPVIFVHGAGTSAPVWTYWQAAFVEAGWPTYNLDLRGHGTSSAVDLTRVGIFDYVDDVNAVAQQLGTPPVLVGWSMGGHI
ncbi:MAG: alpha/beta fold hydrolase, partial [Chloroflexi bacterium]|nr:alpha/beta fold hydrolase [Chloroflexota bacterium]